MAPLPEQLKMIMGRAGNLSYAHGPSPDPSAELYLCRLQLREVRWLSWMLFRGLLLH